MDDNKLILLKVDLNAQMSEIRAIYQKIIDRSKKLQSQGYFVLIESLIW